MSTHASLEEEGSRLRQRIVPIYPHLIHYPTAEECAQIAKILDASEASYEKMEREAEAREAQIKPRVVPRDELDRLAQAIWNAPRAVPRSA